MTYYLASTVKHIVRPYKKYGRFEKHTGFQFTLLNGAVLKLMMA